MRRHTLIGALALWAALSGLALAEPPAPTKQETFLPAQPTLERNVTIEGDWHKDGKARLIFSDDDASGSVDTVNLQAELSKDSWFLEMECESRHTLLPGLVMFRAETELLNSARAFARWKLEEGTQDVSAGFETALFGRDKLRLERERTLEVDSLATTQLEYELGLPFGARIGLQATHQGLQHEVGGRLQQDSPYGWGWAVGVKAQIREAELFRDSFERPEVEGSIRWTW